MATTRVVIADDHEPTRQLVRSALEQDGFVVCADVGDAESAVAAARTEHPDLCLLDVHMPGSGIAAAAEISRRVPGCAIVMLTVSADDADLFDALRAGASGYLLKGAHHEGIARALRAVLNGEAALPRTLVARLVEEFRERGRRRRLPRRGQRPVELTSREWEVLDLMRSGLTTSEMAERLFVSPVTIRGHIAIILRKLRVKDRAEAIELLRETPPDEG